MPRSGQVALSDSYVCFWLFAMNYPANTAWRIQFRRPSGTIAYDSGSQTGGNPFYRWSWWWWNYNITDMHTITGTWHILIDLNGTRMISAPVEVRPQRTAEFNRAPEPIAVALEPATPTVDDAIFCRVNTSLVLDDMDYDIVRYRYVWTVNGAVVRDVTTAAHSDAIPHHTAAEGDVVACTVAPGDGRADGLPATASATLPRSPAADFDKDGDVDLSDFSTISRCFNGPNNPAAGAECGPADLDADADVDLADYTAFARCFNGPNRTPACM